MIAARSFFPAGAGDSAARKGRATAAAHQIDCPKNCRRDNDVHEFLCP
jgi:hypothetical protein